MELFAQLIKPGDHVVEVGGHIGFITAFFSYCVCPKGKVTVFEPGSNNLGYNSKNIMHPSLEEFGPIFLIEAAVGPESGEITFYEDGITGQNNSVIPNFSGLESNAKMAFVEVCLRERKVEMVALDSKLMGQPISFVKIDVEGFEMGVLSGMKQILIEHQPIVMVEIQADHVKIFNLFQALDYSLFSEFRIPVLDPLSMNHNNFALHGEKHSVQIQSIFEVGT
ncbi:MAG: FkbM family methyltransferase [Microgenomates group bacterium]